MHKHYIYEDELDDDLREQLGIENDGKFHTSKKKNHFVQFGDEEVREALFRDQSKRRTRVQDNVTEKKDVSDRSEWRQPKKKKTKRRVKSEAFDAELTKGEERLSSRLNTGRAELEELAKNSHGREGLIARVKLCLQLNVVPKVVPCRKSQEESIRARMITRIRDDASEMIFVSGAPGTGKTLTVHRVIHTLVQMKKSGSFPQFHVVAINCLNDLPSGKDIFSRLWMALKGEKLSAHKSQQALGNKWFMLEGPAPEYVVLLLDELDALWVGTRNITVLHTLMEWMARPKSRLLVIGISNTINLTQRLKDQSAKTGSRIGAGAIHPVEFAAYTSGDIINILVARLKSAKSENEGEEEEEVPLFDLDAINLCAVKTASDRGDIRRALQVSLMAVEKMEKMGSPKITLEIISNCLRDLREGSWSQCIANASLYEKLFLWCVAQDFKATGREDTTFADVEDRLSRIMPLVDLEDPGMFVWETVCHSLLASHVLVMDDKKNIVLPNAEGEYKTVDDVMYFLKSEEDQQDNDILSKLKVI